MFLASVVGIGDLFDTFAFFQGASTERFDSLITWLGYLNNILTMIEVSF